MKRKVIITSLILLFLIILSNSCHAAISASSKTVKSGGTVSITITSNPGVAAYKVDMTKIEEGLTFISCSGGEVGGTSVTNAKSENMTTLATYNFKVPNVTTDTKYTVSFSATGMETANLEPVANSSTKATITVKAPVVNTPPTTPAPEPTTPTEPSTPTEPTQPAEPVISSNANLSNLGIRPNDFSGFRASKTSYEVTVPNEVSSIEIYASKQDSKASVSGIGQKTLQEGSNLFKIVVTAEAGNTKTYQLNIIRQVAGTEITPNNTEDPSNTTGQENTTGLSKLEIDGFKFDIDFAVNVYRYEIELKEDEKPTIEQIKENLKAEVNFEGGVYEIISDKLDEENNEVVISVKDADGREIAIYTLVFKYPEVEDTADTAMLVTNIDEPFEIDIDKLVILLSITTITIIALISTINSYKQRKILKENGLIKEKQVYDENEEEIIEEPAEQVAEVEEKEEKEENKDYIEDIFKTGQMTFEADDKDFVKKKRGKGKHS